jgi:hypothetical protein
MNPIPTTARRPVQTGHHRLQHLALLGPTRPPHPTTSATHPTEEPR